MVVEFPVEDDIAVKVSVPFAHPLVVEYFPLAYIKVAFHGGKRDFEDVGELLVGAVPRVAQH